MPLAYDLESEIDRSMQGLCFLGHYLILILMFFLQIITAIFEAVKGKDMW